MEEKEGTGAAPVEFSNSLGTPMRDALHYVHNQLLGYDLKKDIRLIASGKIISGFHIARAIAMGGRSLQQRSRHDDFHWLHTSPEMQLQ